MTNRYAYVVDDIVREIIVPPDGLTLADCRHADFIAQCIACSDEVEEGWFCDRKTKTFSPPPAPAELTNENLIAYAANKRWQIETGGFTLNGAPVATDDRSKIMIMGARLKAQSDPTYVEQWKINDGEHIDLGAEQLIAISNAVLDFVSACFAAEASVVAKIQAGKITTTVQIDAYAWPGGAA